LYRNNVSSRFSIAPTRIGVWTSGVRADFFDNRRVDRARVERLKCQLGIGEKLAILYHGVLSPFRGLQQVVRALALLSSRGRRDVIWIVLGDGPVASELTCLAEKEGVSDAVRVMDPVSYEDVPDYLSAADVGILPYPNIGWLNMNSPLKLLEYLAMEKPVLLTDIPAHRAVLGDSRCAFYMGDNSPTTIANAVQKLVEEKHRLPEVGKQGRDIVLNEFTWEAQAQKLIGYVAKLGSEKGVMNG
jgi:glycosyltransferase involved in cell wall biosynthesis